MATVVNNPQPVQSSDNGYGFLVGVVLLIVALVVLFYFGLPLVRSGFGGGTQISVPDHFNVNVQQPK